MEPQPSKSDIEAVFHRLRANPANKVCFDCNAKNPTWSSVTYGVFICIDCSAVHRSLGVHLTFVRSTQLDTNWTWVQLRQMQLGGNTNARQFFSQHNCITNDAQKKYNSRAAQLYKDKLHQAALNSLKTNTQLHIHPHVEQSEDKEVDFFTEQENFVIPDEPQKIEESQSLQKVSTDPEEGPKVDFSTSSEPRKSTIATRKAPSKKSGLGAKKGLGATKVKTNFADLEREAEIAEESRQRAHEESAKAAALQLKEQEDREAAVRLAYKDLSNEQQKREEQLRKQDPKKAEQLERLGMGVGLRQGVSHSAFSDMKEIEQENVQQTQSTLSNLGKLSITDNDSFFNDYSFSSGFNMNRSNKLESFLAETRDKEKDSWVIVEDPVEKPKSTYRTPEKTKTIRSVESSSDAAQKKFGNAKAISSDQFFNDRESDYETKANLSRFQGSSSISSAEFFGNGKEATHSSQSLQNYDLEDVKDSVRQGVTKVAGKISSLANGVMSSLQERYGY